MTKKNLWWRPSEMSEEKIKKLEEAFALDCSVGEACFYADITKTTYYNWLEKNPKLVDRFEALREKPVLLARQSVVKGLKESPDLALKYLERKRKNEFSLKTEVDNTIKGNIDVSLKEVSTEDLIKMLQN